MESGGSRGFKLSSSKSDFDIEFYLLASAVSLQTLA